MKNYLIFLCAALFLIACTNEKISTTNSEQTQPVSNNLIAEKKTDPESQPTVSATPKVKIPAPKIISFSIQGFFRHSPKQDAQKNMIPPFDYGEVSFFIESTKVKKGDLATAIWLNNAEENLSLKIKNVSKMPYLNCTQEETGSDIEFEKITDRRLLEMKAVEGKNEDQPFDFFVIYPAVKNARRLNKAELTKAMLPESVEVADVFAAVDLNKDGTPDLLVANYCCYDSSQCDCTNNYKKINSEWKFLGGSEPC